MNAIFRISNDITYSNLKSAASNDPIRFVISGACVDLVNKKLVATDGHLLVVYPIDVISNKDQTDTAIVPLNLFNRSRYMTEMQPKDIKKASIDYHLNDDYAEAKLGNDLMYRCKYIEGKYPIWKNVMPKEEEKQIVDFIGINPNVITKLLKALPKNIITHYKMTLFAKNRAIQFDEINPKDRSAVIAIAMPVMLD